MGIESKFIDIESKDGLDFFNEIEMIPSIGREEGLIYESQFEYTS